MLTTDRPKAVLAWSSGKDSAYALHLLQQSNDYNIVGVFTTVTSEFKRVSMHGVREELLERQLERVDLPLSKVTIPWPCTNAIYEEIMSKALSAFKDQGVSHVIFGDLFLEDIRAYREAQMHKLGMHCVFPLWLKDTTQLADEMINSGLRAIITCIDPKVLKPEFAGREFGPALHRDLPAGIDPCGEHGEFHTVVVDGPMFSSAIKVSLGEVVTREGFVYADVLLA